jgi:hypothetical protein
MDLRPGSRWRSAVCDTEVVVVRAPAAPATLDIGGAGALPGEAGRPSGAQSSPVARYSGSATSTR